MTPAFKPMLADPADLKLLRFPVLGSPKIDGVRAVILDGVVTSRSLKPIPNPHVQAMFGRLKFLDGELVVGSPTSTTLMQDTMSGVMSKSGAPDVKYYVFDHVENLNTSFSSRRVSIEVSVGWYNAGAEVVVVPQRELKNLAQVLTYEEECLNQGYEGIMLRDPLGFYKCGRSTAREQALVKLKRFVDAEAKIVGFEEEQRNDNEATTNELGRTKRSTAKAGKVAKGTLGAFIVEGLADPYKGVRFNVGGGLTAAQRVLFWEQRDKLVGETLTYKSFLIGVKTAPRFPIFVALRDAMDMS